MSKSGKGSQFEREICTLLSEWWTNGKRSDIFWRTSNSGGRATVRKQKGKTTQGQYGDICATDPIGNPFTDLFLVELKRGYSEDSIEDLFQKTKGTSRYQQWFTKVIKESEEAKIPYWLLIVKKNRRIPFVYFDSDTYSLLDLQELDNTIDIDVTINKKNWCIGGVSLVTFLESLKPSTVRHEIVLR